ncbi:MAG: hypothetical protein J6N72_10610 [Psychrobacter sp.]|nr:hypothetical protein [Psychrobacter sp.]
MRKHLIKPCTELSLLSHGLTLDLYLDENAENPRNHSKLMIVGVDVKIPDYVERGSSLEEFVDNYCSQVLHCGKDDIVWRGIHRFIFNDCVEYAVAASNSVWDPTVIGFMYVYKRTLRENLKIYNIDGRAEYKVTAQLEVELERLARFENKEVYEFVLGGDGDNNYECVSGIDGKRDKVDRAVKNSISSIVGIVDKSINKVQVIFEYDLFYIQESVPHMAVIAPEFKKEFGFNPMFGKPVIDTVNHTITVNVLTGSLPSIYHTVEASQRIDLAQTIRIIAKNLSDRGDHPEISNEMVESNLSVSKPSILSVNKPPIMDKIFVMALFSELKGVKRVIG